MAERRMKVCDQCGAVDGAERGVVREYTVVFEDGRLRPDLCEVDAHPLFELRDLLKSSFVPAGERKQKAFRVVDEAEVRAARKTTRTTRTRKK